jgi:MFS family permease
MWVVINRYKEDLDEETEATPQKTPVTFRKALQVIRVDIALRYFVLAGIIENVGYSQIESNLPQYLKGTFPHGVTLYSVLLATNAIFVVIFQMPISSLAAKRTPLQVMTIGSLIFAFGYLGIGLSTGIISMVVSMIVLTIGEILVFPTNSILLDQLAPEGMRGTYFGAGGLRNIGHSLGPVLGGWILSQWSGNVLFYLMAILVAGSSILLFRGSKVQGGPNVKESEQATFANS